ncbi:ABC transporter permease [Ramlibacter sp.]|uniref:ABC transporter permease n=1 Tax=Ramlibacter sp. TaxID=1917967 RepID=UPI002FC975BB
MNGRTQAVVFPLITLTVLIGLWFFLTVALQIPNYILPRPEAVLEVLVKGYVQGAFWKDVGATLSATLVGYAMGCGAGVLLGALLAESKTFERFVYPFVVALQSMPKVALAPVLIVWFGFGMSSKVVMVALVCFFPVFINTIVGIRQTPSALVNMMRSFSGSRFHVFLHVKVKSALGHIFAGLQIAVVLSLIGAVVGEFVASSRGLGYLIQVAQSNVDLATMFASLIGLAAIGIVGTQLIRLIHARVVFWDRPDRHGTVSE